MKIIALLLLPITLLAQPKKVFLSGGPETNFFGYRDIELHPQGNKIVFKADPIKTSIVTNLTVETNEFIPERDAPYIIHPSDPSQYPKHIPATEKTETIQIIEIKMLTFEWEGEKFSVKKERVISTKERKFKKKEGWEEVK